MARPKFRENEKVEVIQGFYRGNIGIIVGYHSVRGFIFTYFSYVVVFDKSGNRCVINQSDLRSLDNIKEEFNKKLENIIK